MADVLLNRPADSAGHDILLNTSRELLIVSDSAGLSVITGGVDSSLLLSTAAGGSGIEQSTLDSANTLIASLRSQLDSAGSGGGSSQRWIS